MDETTIRTEIVICGMIGPIALSYKAMMLMEKRQSTWTKPLYKSAGKRVLMRGCPRHDPLLVQVVKELGKKAAAPRYLLNIVTITGNKYFIARNEVGEEYVVTPENLEWQIAQ